MKYSKDLDQSLVNKVKNFVAMAGLDKVVDVKPVCLLKSNGEYGAVLKANEITGLFTGNPDIIVVALYEAALLRLDDESQNMLIESLISTIEYDLDKDKVNIRKPEINVPISMLAKYNNEIVNKIEVAYHTVEQINEEEKARKQAEKEAKKLSKKRKSY